MKKTARYSAINALVTLKKTRRPIKQILQNSFDSLELSDKDRHLSMNLVYGVLRWQDYLDYVLSELCRQPLKKIKPPVYYALSTGLYQLIFLERIPESAAVNESVKALKMLKTPQRLQGFTNGVLRNFIRSRQNFTPPAPPKNSTDLLNHPKWLTDRWMRSYGEEKMVKICANNTEEPHLALRINTNVISRSNYIEQLDDKNFTGIAGSYSPASILLPNFQGSIHDLPGYDEGYFHIQDQAAQLASVLLGPHDPKYHYLDCCAGLGGKTIHLAELVQDSSENNQIITGNIIAVEPEKSRFTKLQENILRAGIQDCLTCKNDSLAKFSETCSLKFDRVLLDAPCSGTGVTGRHPDIRWNRLEEDITRYSVEQLKLLEQASKLVASGGVLLYATCSIELEENDAVISSFLKGNDHFMLDDISSFLTDDAQTLCRGSFFAPLPSHQIDGFFAARLVKKG